jgi:hypothetical protein
MKKLRRHFWPCTTAPALLRRFEPHDLVRHRIQTNGHRYRDVHAPVQGDTRELPSLILLSFEWYSWNPVALARAILLLQIQRTLDPSRTPSATLLVSGPDGLRVASHDVDGRRVSPEAPQERRETGAMWYVYFLKLSKRHPRRLDERFASPRDTSRGWSSPFHESPFARNPQFLRCRRNGDSRQGS